MAKRLKDIANIEDEDFDDLDDNDPDLIRFLEENPPEELAAAAEKADSYSLRDAYLSMRVSSALLADLKQAAKISGFDHYQTWVHITLEEISGKIVYEDNLLKEVKALRAENKRLKAKDAKGC